MSCNCKTTAHEVGCHELGRIAFGPQIDPMRLSLSKPHVCDHARCDARIAELEAQAKLGEALVAVLVRVAGDGGTTEGAVECAERIIRERDALAAAMPSEGADAALAYAAMQTERDAAIAQRNEINDVRAEEAQRLIAERVCAAAERAEKVEAFLACLLDKPEDRLYHAADKTWWRREGMHLKAADPPPEVEKAEAERDTALAETRRLRETLSKWRYGGRRVFTPESGPLPEGSYRCVACLRRKDQGCAPNCEIGTALSAEAPGAKEEADDR